MRTTLKRGMGRVATLNGNGRAVLPPPVVDPMRRYRQPPPPPRSTGRLIGKVFGWIMLALVVGYDQRAGAGGFGAKDSRSDTLMLIRADPQQDTLSLLSFPRDLNVTIHCPQRAPVTDRINAAWTDCGAQGTLDTVQQLTGI